MLFEIEDFQKRNNYEKHDDEYYLWYYCRI